VDNRRARRRRADHERRTVGGRAGPVGHGHTIAATLTTEPFSSRDCW
jgi:hypothetical protein